MKETQGSAEETSFGQMKNINRDGCYTIGSRKKTIHTSPSQLIKMNVREREKVLPKYTYTLDDLSDLESKLVLITGRMSTEREEVEQFLLVSISVPILGNSCIDKLLCVHPPLAELRVCQEDC